MDPAGKIALVTGASRGVGAAVAVALARSGATVVCAARSTRDAPQRTPGTLDDTVARIRGEGGTALAVPVNLAVADEVPAMVARAVAESGGLDILVNNAAITFVGDLSVPMRRYDLMMDVNLRAPLLATRAAAPVMAARGGGSIINVSSAAALFPFPDTMAYGMSKIALERFTVDAARQLQAQRIAVNCFRIDIAVASEGFLANTPGADHSTWEPPEVAAEGILWMIQRPVSYSGQCESMYALRAREGIMASRAERPLPPGPPPSQQLFNGLAATHDSMFREPYRNPPNG